MATASLPHSPRHITATRQVQRLQRRLQYLRQRVRDTQDGDVRRNYDHAERAALIWALERLEAYQQLHTTLAIALQLQDEADRAQDGEEVAPEEAQDLYRREEEAWETLRGVFQRLPFPGRFTRDRDLEG